jgi:hypothetical protein
METVNFWTAVSYGDQQAPFTQQVLEKVDAYFYLGDKKAIVIPEEFRQGHPCAFLLDVDVTLLSTALKVASYLTVILPIVMLAIKAILRTCYTFYLTDARQLLEEGIEITPAITATIQRLLPKIPDYKSDPAVQYYDNGEDYTFSLTAFPNLIFKRSRSPDVEQINQQTFTNKIDAKQTCLVHHLSQLVIPHSKLFNVAADGQSHSFIAEECPAYRHNNESMQEQFYYDYAHDLEPTFHQLATFIAKTGWERLQPRPPVIDTAPDHRGPRKIALLNFKSPLFPSAPQDPFYGIPSVRWGLIDFLPSERIIDDVISVATSHQIAPAHTTPIEKKRQRLAEIAEYARLRQFHSENGLLQNPRKPIEVNDLTILLALDLNATGSLDIYPRTQDAMEGQEEATLQKMAEDLIRIMNQDIEDNFDRGMRGSTKAMRFLWINTMREPLKDYYPIDGANMNTNLLFCFLTALKNQHKIFDFRLSYGNIRIQA